MKGINYNEEVIVFRSDNLVGKECLVRIYREYRHFPYPAGMFVTSKVPDGFQSLGLGEYVLVGKWDNKVPTWDQVKDYFGLMDIRFLFYFGQGGFFGEYYQIIKPTEIMDGRKKFKSRKKENLFDAVKDILTMSGDKGLLILAMNEMQIRKLEQIISDFGRTPIVNESHYINLLY